MATSPQATPTTNNGYHHNGVPHESARHPLSGTAALATQQPQRRLNLTHVHYTPSWLGLGAAGAALGALGLHKFGWPVALGMGMFGALSLAYMTTFEPARPTLEQVTLRLPALPQELDGLRIGQLSDSHLGLPHTARNLAWAIEQMRREQPDLVVITGDLTHYHWAIPRLPELLGGLSAPLGIYAVPGNHDYWEGIADIQAALRLLDIPLLLNEHRQLRWNGADFWLAGVDDVWGGQPDLDVALRGIPPGAYTLLLAHSPDRADEAARRGVAVQLSGHTHGGHLRLPVLGPFTRPRFGARYVMGQYQIGAMQLYVTRGLGGAPLRLLCRPEATIFTLRHAA